MPAISPRFATSLELVGDRSLVITRRFKAPRKLVFEAWTKAEHLRRWWAPASHGVTLVTCDVDARVGGTYRIVMGRGDERIGFSGTYVEFVPHERLVYLETFDPFPDQPARVTLTFTEHDGVTLAHSREEYPSPEARTMAIDSGMEHGLRESLEQLAELVGELQGLTLAPRPAA